MRIQYQIYGHRRGLALEEVYSSDLISFTDTSDMLASVGVDFMNRFQLCQNCRENYFLKNTEACQCDVCGKLISDNSTQDGR